ncbi:MAG: DNA cytosine methyltransferase [Bacteroidia bacterium]|nr:DNA cytosine methyltransferase [Bacteroidia bacterium]
MSNLTLGSLFDGSGGFPLGGMLAGITPVWASEIEPFPIRVTTKRLPFMKHYGDISAMDGSKIEPVDIITFGSPCQDMSVAGKRDGLDGSRSSLFYEAVRIIKEMRCNTDGKYPRYIVWENVPGAFSSNKGEDFRCVLESICRIKDEQLSVPRPAKWPYSGEILGDGFSVAWRQLDAQFWGVPQRRKRIYLVADFDGGSAGEILFESEGLSGYTPQGFRSWEETAGDPSDGTREAGTLCLNDQGGNRMDITEDKTMTLRAEAHHPPLVFENHSQDSRYRGPDDIAQTVLSTFGTGGNNQPFVVETPKTMKIRCGKDGGGKGPLVQDNKSATLSCNNDQTLFQPKAVDCRNMAVNEELSGTLQAKANGGHSLNYINPVVYGICAKDSNSMKSDNPNSGFYEAKTTRCLDANGGNPSCNQGGMAVVALEGNGSRPSHHGDGYSEEDVSYTLNATEHHAVAYSSSKASFFTEVSEETANCLVATDYKDPPLVNDKPYGFYPQMKAESICMEEEKSGCLVNGTNPGYQNGVIEADYIVRRLTPTECARLQGFPDWWCDDLGTKHPSSEEVYEWYKIFETHRKTTGSSNKPKTEKQIRAFLEEPHSDSAEYKMWGNGVALPCVYFVLSGIVWAHSISGANL